MEEALVSVLQVVVEALVSVAAVALAEWGMLWPHASCELRALLESCVYAVLGGWRREVLSLAQL